MQLSQTKEEFGLYPSMQRRQRTWSASSMAQLGRMLAVCGEATPMDKLVRTTTNRKDQLLKLKADLLVFLLLSWKVIKLPMIKILMN
jgi:hypothetical protein